jgi:hypothetical protein
MGKKGYHKSRLDLKNMGVRLELHPVEKENGASSLPLASFALNKS